MQMDIDKREYKTLDDTLEYIYGSAEVIGLFMAQIMGLPEEAHDFAKMQGRAMQFINFIRDIDEDITLGRRYFPTQDLKEFSLANLLSNSPKQLSILSIISEKDFPEFKKRLEEEFK
jgi:phytoene synthase